MQTHISVNQSLTALPVIKTIDSICQLVSNASDIYSSTVLNTCKVKQRLEELGFDYFIEKCSIENIAGVRRERLSSYLKRLLERLKVPQNRIEEVSDEVQSILLPDIDINYHLINILYNKDTTDNKNVNYTVLIAKFNERMSIDFVHTTLKADFDFVSDILVVKEYLNKQQEGKWGSEKQLINIVPNEVDENELKTLSAYFELVALYKLGNAYGIEMPQPQSLLKEPKFKPLVET